MEKPYYVVDVFADELFGGNPAAVVLDARGLSDSQMQAIAAEFNVSETTFVLPPTPGQSGAKTTPSDVAADLRFRWFTPSIEVDMCGHATIAGAHALVESGRLTMRGEPSGATVHIETRSGVLTSFVESTPDGSDRMIWLDLVDPSVRDMAVPPADLADALGLRVGDFDALLPPVASQDADVLAFVKNAACLRGVKPRFGELGAVLEGHGLRGLCLATVNTGRASTNAQSRFFAPTVGINEDPVTGSVHGPLAAYMVMNDRVPVTDGVAKLVCAQGVPGGRGGVVHALVRPKNDQVHRVRIGGRALTSMRGVLLS